MEPGKVENMEPIYWDFENSYLVAHLNNFDDPKEFKKNLSTQIDLLTQNNGRKILLIINKEFSLSKAEQFFTNHIFVPKIIQKGLKAIAVVGPEKNEFKGIFIENLKGTLEGDILESAFFTDADRAKKWLANQ